VVATHGRGIMILDDITPLRYLNPAMLEQEMAFLPSRPYVLRNQGYRQEFSGNDDFFAPNPPEAAVITYYLKKRHFFGDMHIEIFDQEGNKIKDLPAGKRKGINRVRMGIRLKPPRVPTSKTLSFAGFFGPLMPPGEYTVKIVKNDEVLRGSFILEEDPGLPYSREERALQRETLMKAYRMLEDLAYLDRKVTDAMKRLDAIRKEKLPGGVKKKSGTLRQTLNTIHGKLVATKAEGMFTSEEQLREKIAAVYGSVVNYLGRPTNSQIERLRVLEKEMDGYRQEINDLFAGPVQEINNVLKKKERQPVPELTREAFDKEEKK
jgi:hypothetical protein